jgi:hypothetical protein
MAANPTAPKKAGKKMETQVVRTPSPYGGTLKIDATAVGPVLFDLAKGARKGLRKSRPGIDDVLAELAAAMPTAGAAAGIAQALYQGFVTDTTNITALQQAAPPVLKLAEVMVESQGILEDAREHKLMKIADAIKSTAKHDRNPGVKAPFQKTLAYEGAIADKSVKTRQAKKAAKAAGCAAPARAAAATPPSGGGL